MPWLRGLEYGMEDLKGRVEHFSDQVDLLDIRTETRFGRLEEQVQAPLQKAAADDDDDDDDDSGADDGGDTCDEREDDDGADDSIEDSSKEVTKYPSILRGPRASRSASLHRVCMAETTSRVKSFCPGMEAACVSEEYNHISSCVLLFGDLEEIVFIGILSTVPGGGQLVVLPAYVPGTKVYRCSTYTSRANYALISGIPAKVYIDRPQFLPSVLLVDWVGDISAITTMSIAIYIVASGKVLGCNPMLRQKLV